MEGEKGDGAMVIAAQTDNGGYTPKNIAEEGNTQEIPPMRRRCSYRGL